ncbi:MAG: ABC transporter ATP-binding protein [Clostridiales bacterium]|nr:ABC transporter ATP-binding protein [Clostridiales bacterium]
MKENLLELRHVSKHFGGLKAVDDVNLTIEEGSLHCLIGPNGAGKTTIFKLIMGIYPPTSGEILFNGKDMTKIPTFRRVQNGISIKMQIPGVYLDLSLYDNIRIAVQKYVSVREIPAEINRLIEMVGISEIGNPLVRNMPHGQQQWLEIAMSLASKPKLLLLDEPAAGLGPEETEFTADIVRRINELGTTIIFIDHDMDFVSKIARKTTVLHYGKIFAEGTFDEIHNNQDVINIYLGKV